MLAFGIVHLWMLPWMAAAAVPILIHLWSRRRYREVTWAAMQYLMAALRKRRRRLLLQEWLLLLLRTAVVLLIVLAVAEPYVQHSAFPMSLGRLTHRVLVLDASYSMAYRPDDKTRFEHAQQLAARIVRQASPGDAFTLVLMAAPPRLVVGKPAFEPGEMLQEIERLAVLHTTADVPATLAMVDELVQRVARETPRLARHEVLFLTDLGRPGWATPAGAAGYAQQMRARAAALAARASLAVLDVGQKAVDNAALTDLLPSEAVAIVGRGMRFQASLRNFTATAQPRRVVELLVDGQAVQQQAVDLGPGATASAAFDYIFPAAGDHVVEARLDRDRLEVDNHRYLVLPVREAIRTLCIDGHPSARPFGGTADYLRAALAPDAEAAAGAVRARVAAENALSERDLRRYDCVLLCNVGQFTPGEAKILAAYAGQGGNLVFFLGDRVLPERYNAELGGGHGTAAILPARLGPLVDQPQDRLNPLDYQHPALRAFRGNPLAGLLTTLVAKHYRLEVPANSPARTVLALANGDPLIVEQAVGQGRVVLVATSADLSWTKMPLLPSFVPLVQELLAWCVAGQTQHRNFEVGQPLEGTAPASAAGAAVALLRPDGARETLTLAADASAAGLPGWSYAETTLSGIYRIQDDKSAGAGRPLAVSVNTAESDLTPVTADELRDTIWPGVEFRYQTSWTPGGPPAVANLAGGSSLHVLLLYAVLLMLLTETFLAWRMGHHQS